MLDTGTKAVFSYKIKAFSTIHTSTRAEMVVQDSRSRYDMGLYVEPVPEVLKWENAE